MGVTIKQSQRGQSVYLLSLEYNPPVESPRTGKPVYEEPLKLSVYKTPTTPRMQLFNRDNYERAEAIKKYRESQILKHELKLFTKDYQDDLIGLYMTISKRTDVNYRASFLWFSDFTNGKCPYSDVDAGMVMDYKKYLLDATSALSEKPLSLLTAAQYFNQLRYVLREAFNQGFLAEDLHDCIDPIRTGDNFIELVTDEEIEALKSTPCNQEQIPRMCWFIVLTGVRLNFLLQLKWEDVIVAPGQRPFILMKCQRSKRDDMMYITEESLGYLGKRKKSGLVFEKNHRLLKDLHKWEKDAGVREDMGFEHFRLRLMTLKKSKLLLR